MQKQSGGKFRVGMKVWLEHTREEAVIKRIDKTGVLYVQAGAHVIPVFMSQVSKRMPEPEPTATIEATDQSTDPKRKAPPQITLNVARISEPRICLVFIPQRLPDGEIIRYECGLLNETNNDVKANVTLVYKASHETLNMNASAKSFELIKRFDAEVLNDITSVKIFLTPKNQTLDVFDADVKIKAASFIKKNMMVESLGVEAFVYELLRQFDKAPVKPDVFASLDKKIVSAEKEHEDSKDENDWKLEHLRRLILDKPVAKEKSPTPSEKEIDLHADSFLVSTEGLSATDILLLQLERFQKSLERAVVSGQKTLMVVHGVGKGKLKKEIEKILRDHEHVVDFRDASYPKYGYGATEVILK